MAHHEPKSADTIRPALTGDPLILIVPGLHDSGPRHWQTIWERQGAVHEADCERVELGMWDNPHRNTWVN